MSIINDLWRGEISPQERRKVPEPDYRKLVSRICEAQDKLTKEMSEEARAQFNAYEDLVNEEQYLCLEETFAEGFRLGARLILDVMREQ